MIEQQLDAALLKLREGVEVQELTDDGTEALDAMTVRLNKQTKLVEQRTVALATRANECKAGNEALRAQIDELRGQRLKHANEVRMLQEKVSSRDPTSDTPYSHIPL